MTHITPYTLWLGHAGDGRDLREIHEAGIRALVHLAAEEPADQPTRDLVYCRVPVTDGPGNDPNLLRLAVEITAFLLEHATPTLVYCGAGMSRSPAVAAVGLASVKQQEMDACLRELNSHRPFDVSPGLWNDLRTLFDVRRNG
jgi:protein-tyrosine phosphatase